MRLCKRVLVNESLCFFSFQSRYASCSFVATSHDALRSPGASFHAAESDPGFVKSMLERPARSLDSGLVPPFTDRV